MFLLRSIRVLVVRHHHFSAVASLRLGRRRWRNSLPRPDSFSGGKNFTSSCYNAGVGFDYGLGRGPWSLTAEYNYVNLGKGTNSTFTCASASGTVPTICTGYANFSLDNIHNSFTMNLFRVGLHYSFGGRSTPEIPAASSQPPPPPPPRPPPPQRRQSLRRCVRAPRRALQSISTAAHAI